MAAYDPTEKDDAFLEAFEDPGPPYALGEVPPDGWYRTVVEHSGMFTIAFRHDGTITHVTDQVEFLLGRTRDELVGTNALDLLHPDDLANAAQTIYRAAVVEGWRPPRPYRLLRGDGSYATFEVEGLALFHVEEVASIVCLARWAEGPARVDRVVGLLAASAPLSAIVDELVHVMARPGWRFEVVVQYDRGDGELEIAHTGLARPLRSLDRADEATPWGRACATGEPVYDLGMELVRPVLRREAETAGFRTCWAIPVPDPGHEDALVVVWNFELHPPELGQDIMLSKFQQLLELALLGRARTEALEQQARTDALSGLANRRSFEDAVRAATDDEIAVLIVDLDGFKAVNDELGHAAGDEVIRKVAARLAAALRHDDVAARIGGDEFAILCRHVRSEDDVRRLADRLLDEVARPIEIDGAPAEVGLSIGIAIASREVDADGAAHAVMRRDLERLLDLADRQLYDAKRAGKGRYRLARLQAPGD